MSRDAEKYSASPVVCQKAEMHWRQFFRGAIKKKADRSRTNY